MSEPPQKDSSLFSRAIWRRIIVEGCYIGIISLLAFTIGTIFFDSTKEPIIGRTMAFAVLSLAQLTHSFNMEREKSIFEYGIFSNLKLVYSFIFCILLQVSVISIPFLSVIFKTTSLNTVQWLIVAALSISPLVLVEIEKWVDRIKK